MTGLWLVVYGGACWATSLHTYRVQLHCRGDLRIPFVPEATFFYLSLFMMLWLAPFVLQTPERLRFFAVALAVLFLCSGAGFLLMPSEEVRETPVVEGLVGQVFRFADWVNLSYNNLPCLHVGMAFLCASFYSKYLSFHASALLWLWALAISLSTLLTHQHYIADVLAGAALAVLVASAWRTGV